MEQGTTLEPDRMCEEPCVCRDLGTAIAAFLGVRSEGAQQHLRNARIEVLKAVRAVIDDRIQHLSHPGAKGTRIPVD